VEKKIDKEEPEHEQCDSQEKPVGDKKIAEPEISGSGKTKPASLEQKRFWRDWTSLEKTGVIFNGMLVLFTVIYAFVSLWQASIAQQGASAAQISAETAQQGLKLSVRPGIEMSDFKLSSFVVGQEARMDFNVMNVGPGRAKEIGIGGLLLLCPNEAVGSCLISCPRTLEPEPFPKMDLEPGTKKGITRTQGTISEQQANIFSSGSSSLYFCGVVTCKDILSNPWDFPFCYAYDQKENRWAYCPG